MKRSGFLKEAAEIVHAHHERYDGKGYPRELKGEAMAPEQLQEIAGRYLDANQDKFA